MLTSLRIQNFKAWRDTGNVRLAPLPVIFGANSAGKSSLGHLLLALKQTALSADRRRALHLGDANTLIDLGTFTDCLHGHDTSKPLIFKMGWRMPSVLEVKDPLQPTNRYLGDELSLDVTLAVGKSGQPEATSICYVLSKAGQEVLDVELSRNDGGNFNLTSNHYKFARNPGRPPQFEEPEKFIPRGRKSSKRPANCRESLRTLPQPVAAPHCRGDGHTG